MKPPVPLLFTLLFFITSLNTHAQHRYEFTKDKMGSPFRIVFYADDSLQAAATAEKAFEIVDSLNLIFSDYVAESEINRIALLAGDDTSILISPPLFELIKISIEAFNKTSGAFDITAGSLSKLWRLARKNGQFPQESEIEEARENSGMRFLHLDEKNATISLKKKGVSLDFGGIAKGYIAQSVSDYLQKTGIHASLIDAGGDITVTDPPPNAPGWRIAIERTNGNIILHSFVILKNASIATSGDIYQYMENNGKFYSHILNPRTGYGMTNRRKVTVIAGNGTKADWLATAVSILPLRKARKLIRQEKACAIIIYTGKKRLREKTIDCSKFLNRY